MKTLNKTLAGLGILGTAAAAIFGGLYLNNYFFDKKLKIGSRTPKFSNENIVGHAPWHDANYTKYGERIEYQTEDGCHRIFYEE